MPDTSSRSGRLSRRQIVALVGFAVAVIGILIGVRILAPPPQVVLTSPTDDARTEPATPVDPARDGSPTVAAPVLSAVPTPEEGRFTDPDPVRDAEDRDIAEAFVVAVIAGDDATRAALADGPTGSPPDDVVGSSGRTEDPQVQVLEMSSHIQTGDADRSLVRVIADLTSPAGDSIGQWLVAVSRHDGQPVVTGFQAG